ncbi:MAG: MlaD family protein [Spirochaetia bacterium]|nr:MlaD family protein [Spirochaetia bacterium]
MNWLQNILVGTMFFGALVIVGYFTIISDEGPFAKKDKQVVIFFENAEGLKKGTRITVLGVPMGNIEEITLVSVNSNDETVPDHSLDRVSQKVAVSVNLRQPVIFYRNYRISVKSESLLSDRVIAIDPGTPADTAGHPNSKLPVLVMDKGSLSDTDMNALEYLMDQKKSNEIHELAGESGKDPIASITDLISENRADVRRTINNVAEISDKVNSGKGTLGMLVNDDDLHDKAHTLVNDAEVVVQEAREGFEDTREQAPVDSFLRVIFSAF